MIVCVNTYRVKPGLRNELIKEITGKNIPQELHALQGNLYFNFWRRWMMRMCCTLPTHGAAYRHGACCTGKTHYAPLPRHGAYN